ncbi:hypothetical protein bpr_I0243 [Butyrivibrio proteoclasticus B316]|uniref:DUF819 domain-containing protein n=1 Tax=Butyrivibrio proteoclasticus (strain ATCC 51982 / DSM 14932 / B316) TaxID=515622 RepID=E0RXF4_BUTPB|nr:DUF819 family protein [Butyrivibrio proteoclasticus]ADL32992.1 hypothetical protein bpr_I0243 [Butyrivibrio proteoclasticus B316]
MSIISESNNWALISIMFLSSFVAIYLEQKYKWAAKISGAVITLLIAVILTNINVIPASAPVFDDIVWGYAVPLAIPLLLLNANIFKIWKDTGRLLFIFLIGAAGTLVGAIAGTALLGKVVDGLPGVAAMMTGSYIGGGVNFTAVADAFHVDGMLISSATVADNLNMAIYFMILIGIASSVWFRKHFPHPHIEEVEQNGNTENGQTLAAQYWERSDISLKDIAAAFAYAAIVVMFSKLIAGFLSDTIPQSNAFLKMLNTFFGSQYVWITNISMIFASCFEKQAKEIHGAKELGTWLIYLFYFVIGVPASILMIIKNAPILLLFCFILVVFNMLFCFVFGKLFKFNLEEIIVASNANIGGPTTAAGMAISQGWSKLVGPCMLVGTFGYVIGTWLGIVVGSILGA